MLAVRDSLLSGRHASVREGHGRVMQRFMGTSGAESTCVAGAIVMGQTEAPVTIRPFLASLRNPNCYRDDQRHGHVSAP